MTKHAVRRGALALTLPLLALAFVARPTGGTADAGPLVVASTLTDINGKLVTATNHLVRGVPTSGPGAPGSFLLVWAGDYNAADLTVKDIPAELQRLGSAVDLGRLTDQVLPDLAPGQDFLAVLDADSASPTYGKVLNTVTVGPLVENEPHHMQYIWHQGHNVFAGGLFSATTYVFDVKELPLVKLAGTSLPVNTLCGSVPDAYWVLKDGSAYGTYMGGPVVPGPCGYTDGSSAIGNGFAGTPGEVVYFDRNGGVVSQNKATTDLPVDRDSARCPGVPTIIPSCANPHGIQVREDLNRMITTDYAEPKNVVADPLRPLDPHLFRDTVRVWDITDRAKPTVVSVSAMPDGPRTERNPGHEEPRGIMEGTVTNLPGHRGAFSSSMCGGVIYYTPDITAAAPAWREVFDDTTAARSLLPNLTEGAGCDGGGWVQTSLDDKYLYHAVIGRNPGSLSPSDPGMPKMVYTLDIQKLLAAGTRTTCSIDKISEVWSGGSEPDCPALVSALPLPDGTSGGPHWGTLDNFRPNGDGTWSETTAVNRLAVSNYFVARSTVDGNHKVCMVDVAAGKLTLDETFLDENEGTPCVNFNRTVWPHGKTGNAKPHSELFVIRDDRIRQATPAAAVGPATKPGPGAPAAARTAASVPPATPPRDPVAQAVNNVLGVVSK